MADECCVPDVSQAALNSAAGQVQATGISAQASVEAAKLGADAEKAVASTQAGASVAAATVQANASLAGNQAQADAARDTAGIDSTARITTAGIQAGATVESSRTQADATVASAQTQRDAAIGSATLDAQSRTSSATIAAGATVTAATADANARVQAAGAQRDATVQAATVDANARTAVAETQAGGVRYEADRQFAGVQYTQDAEGGRLRTSLAFAQRQIDTVLPLIACDLARGCDDPIATPGLSFGTAPYISARPVFTPAQIQQQVNQLYARNDARTVSSIRQAQGDLAGRGFSSNSPLIEAIRIGLQGQNLQASVAGAAQVRLGSAQANLDALLHGQELRSAQYNQQQNVALDAQKNAIARQVGVLGAVAQLVAGVA